MLTYIAFLPSIVSAVMLLYTLRLLLLGVSLLRFGALRTAQDICKHGDVSY